MKNKENQSLQRILSNPFYCLESVCPIYAQEHEPLISEKEWIGANVQLIKEIGSEKFLIHLLENLKGNYVTSDDSESNLNDVPGLFK